MKTSRGVSSGLVERHCIAMWCFPNTAVHEVHATYKASPLVVLAPAVLCVTAKYTLVNSRAASLPVLTGARAKLEGVTRAIKRLKSKTMAGERTAPPPDAPSLSSQPTPLPRWPCPTNEGTTSSSTSSAACVHFTLSREAEEKVSPGSREDCE